MNENYRILIIFIFLFWAVIYAAFKIITLKRLLDQQNTKLIQYYLDAKFVHDNLMDSLNRSDSVKFCNEILAKIKIYYNLEDIIIVDSLTRTSDVENSVIRSKAIECTKNNSKLINKFTKNNNFGTCKFFYGEKEYEIFISKINHKPDEGDGYIICIESAPSLLSTQERQSLETNLNILKNRFFYS